MAGSLVFGASASDAEGACLFRTSESGKRDTRAFDPSQQGSFTLGVPPAPWNNSWNGFRTS